jgi:hypothetical protein
MGDRIVKIPGLSRSFARSVAAWIFWGIVAALVNVLFVARNFVSEGRGDALAFFLGAAPLVMSLQIILSALLIRIYRIRSRAWAMITGGVTGFVMPVLLFALLWIIASAKPSHWGHYLVDGLVWTMLSCGVSLFGIGLVSGISIGHAGWKNWV